MEWSIARSGQHAAVVGYNSGPLKRFNHPASGLDFIVADVSCIESESSPKRDTTLGETETPTQSTEDNNNLSIMQLANRDELNDNYIACTTFANCENLTEIKEAHDKISPCPRSSGQAQEDHRFWPQPETNCYVWAFAIEKGDGAQGSKRTYTKQCCYDTK